MQTFSQAKAMLIDLLNRADTKVTNVDNATITTDYASEWLQNAQRDFYNTRAAQIPPFEASVSGTLVSGSNAIPVPTNENGIRYIVVSDGTNEYPLYKVSTDEIIEMSGQEVERPYSFSRIGNSIITQRPSKDWTYKLYFYRFLDSIPSVEEHTYVDDDNTLKTHWLLNNMGEALVHKAGTYGALFYGSEPLLQKAEGWKAVYDTRIEDVIQRSKFTDVTGSTPRMRSPMASSIPRRR